MAKPDKTIRRLTLSEARRLVDGLRVALDFIRANIPADVIATKQTHGWERAHAALKLKPNTSKNVSEQVAALLWAFIFIVNNYEGNAPELADVPILLGELGFLEIEGTSIHPDHLTRQ